MKKPLLMLCFLSMTANAENVSDIPIAKCDLANIVGLTFINATHNVATYSNQATPLLNEQIKLAEKAKIPSKSLDEQLSEKDKIAFEIIRQRLITINLQKLIESNKSRDFNFFEKLTKLAYQNYRFGEVYDKNDSNYPIQMYINYLREMSKKFPIDYDKVKLLQEQQCSLNYALDKFEQEGINKIDSIVASPALRQLQELKKKYNLERIDASKLSESDKIYYQQIEDSYIIPLLKAYKLVDDIENIKLLSIASDIVYQSLKDDLNFSGGNSNSYGENLKRIKSGQDISEKMKVALDVLEIVDKNYPSAIAKQQAELAKYASEAQKKNPVVPTKPL